MCPLKCYSETVTLKKTEMEQHKTEKYVDEESLEFQAKAFKKSKAHTKQEESHSLFVSHTESEYSTGRLSPEERRERRAQRRSVPDRERVTVTETTTESAYVESMMEFIGVEDFSAEAEEPLKDLAKIRYTKFGSGPFIKIS